MLLYGGKEYRLYFYLRYSDCCFLALLAVSRGTFSVGSTTLEVQDIPFYDYFSTSFLVTTI